MPSYVTNRCVVSLLLAACITASAEAAAPLLSEDVEEIVVTATRRSESILDVPLSISAYSQEGLDQKAVRDIADLSRITPSLTFTPAWAGSSNISIRGISSIIGAGTTGIYIDDTPIQVRFVGSGSTSTNAYPAIFDLERVEVLRGPQGTLFGAGSEGGTVRFITPEPGLTDYSGNTKAEYSFTRGGDQSKEIAGAVGGPFIPDTLGFRASAYYRKDGGWIDRVDYPSGRVVAKNSNSVETVALRAAMLWAPTSGLKITPAIDYQEVRRDDSNQYWRNISDPAHGSFRNGQALAQPGKDRFVLSSLKLEITLPFASLFSNTSYFDRTNPSLADYTNYLPELLGAPFDTTNRDGVTSPTDMINDQRTFTQEVRLQSTTDGNSALSWLVGAFYQASKQSATELVHTPGLDILSMDLFGLTTLDAFGLDLLQPGNLSYQGFDHAEDRQIAGFAQLEYHLTRNLTAIAGVRIAKTKFNFSNSQNGAFNGGPTASTGEQSETPITPKFGINYEPSNNSLIYASAAKGFRTGGANTPVPSARCSTDLTALGIGQAPDSYKSDNVWSYELGAKTEAGDHRFEMEGSAFYIKWNGIQNSVQLLTCGFQYIANLGAATSKGFDLHLSGRIFDPLKLEGSIGYTDAQYSQNVLGSPTSGGDRGVIVAEGDKLPVAPWHVSLAGTYEFPLLMLDSARGYIHLDYDVSSGYPVGTGPSTISYDPLDTRNPATHFASGRLGIKGNKLDISLFAQNIFNSSTPLNTTHDTLQSALFREVTYRPRTIGLTFVSRF